MTCLRSLHMYCVWCFEYIGPHKTMHLFAYAFILLAFGGTLCHAADFEPNSVSNYSGQGLFNGIQHIYTADEVVIKAPLIDRDNVVLRTKIGVEVFNIKTSQKLWSYPIETKHVQKLFVSNGVVYWVEGENTLPITHDHLLIKSWPQNTLPKRKNKTHFPGRLQNTFCAFRIKNGKEVWKKDFGIMDEDVEPLFYQDKMFLNTTENTLAIDVKSGNILWSIDYGSSNSCILLARDQIVVCRVKITPKFNQPFTIEASSKYLCINTENGHILSEHELNGDVRMATYDDGKLYCYNLLYTPISSEQQSERLPGIMPFMGMGRPSLECRNIDDGSVVWQMFFDGSVGFSHSKLHLWRGYIYLFNRSLLFNSNKLFKRNTLHKIDAETGNSVWQTEFEPENNKDLIELVFFPGVLIFSNGKLLYALSTINGEILSQWKGEKVSQISQINSKIIGADGSKIYILDYSEYTTERYFL